MDTVHGITCLCFNIAEHNAVFGLPPKVRTGEQSKAMKYCYTYNLDDTICLATQAEHDEYPLDHPFDEAS